MTGVDTGCVRIVSCVHSRPCLSHDADGSHVREISRPPRGFEDHYPTWSPDGRTIVFQRDTSTQVPKPGKLIAVDVATRVERTVYRFPRWAPGC